jgi:geranylgeranyl pyrophosphate synthase
LKEFEQFITDNIPEVDGFHPHFREALKLILTVGGKRFRPQLLFSVVEAFQPNLLKNSFYVALAIEALHTYSLVHDDLPSMDNADLRRGVETLHKRYDEVTAILVGDALNTFAFETLSNSPFRDDVRVELIRSLAHNGGLNGMVIGQAIDCHFENQPLDIEKIKFLHTYKTGKLIASSLQMGAIVVGEKDLKDRLYRFGLSLGLLFQIQDDILDELESDEEAGKTTSNDGDKNSFVTILGVEKAMEEANREAENVSEMLQTFPENLQKSLGELLERYIYRHRK